MRSKHSIIAVLALFAAIIFASGCGKQGCPEGMHEETIQGGQTICVPNNLGKR